MDNTPKGRTTDRLLTFYSGLLVRFWDDLGSRRVSVYQRNTAYKLFFPDSSYTPTPFALHCLIICDLRGVGWGVGWV